jgi:3-oxoadipate enol-lactonase
MTVKVKSAGVKLNVVVRGPEDAPPVVLLHAFPLSHRMWEPQLETFADHYRIIAPDHRGFGGSEPGDGQYTMELLVDDLLAVLDELGLERVVGCGVSMGGYVLLRALDRAPERFRAVVLVDTRSQPDDDAGKLARAATIKAVKSDGVDAFAAQFSGRLLGPSTLSRDPDLRTTVADMIKANGALAICGGLLALATRTDTTAALKKLSVPALIVVGEEDAITPVAFSRSMADAAPGAKLVTLPAAGHLSNLEAPAGFNRALREFLEGL